METAAYYPGSTDRTSILKTAFIITVLLASMGTSAATDLNNIESITPAGNNQINITGSLDIQGNSIESVGSITNYYASSCNSGDVIVDVNDDGSFDCVDATSEVQNDFVSRSGDTMTGNLDMQGNEILDIGNRGASIRIGDPTGVHGITDADFYGISIARDTDNAYFGLRNYGDDRDDVVINNEQNSDDIRIQSDGQDIARFYGTGGVDFYGGRVDFGGNHIQNADWSNANDLDSNGNVNHGLSATLNDGNSANQNIDMNGNQIRNARSVSTSTRGGNLGRPLDPETTNSNDDPRYWGLLRLEDGLNVEASGVISGERTSFARGTNLQFHAESGWDGDNSPNPSDSMVVVDLMSGNADSFSRLVQFEHNGYNWVGIERDPGGCCSYSNMQFTGQSMRGSSSTKAFPKILGPDEVSSVSDYSGPEYGTTGSARFGGKLDMNNEKIVNADVEATSGLQLPVGTDAY